MLEVKISSLYVKQSWVQIAKGNAFGSQVRPGLRQTPQKKKKKPSMTKSMTMFLLLFDASTGTFYMKWFLPLAKP
jgi:hypothetical protein